MRKILPLLLFLACAAGLRAQVVNPQPPTVTPITTSTYTDSSIWAEFLMNENATAGQSVTVTLPAPIPGMQKCLWNFNNGSAANTGTLTFQTAASGQFIVSAGTASASGGFIISAGAAGDLACVVGIDSTHWAFTSSSGTWTLH